MRASRCLCREGGRSNCNDERRAQRPVAHQSESRPCRSSAFARCDASRPVVCIVPLPALDCQTAQTVCRVDFKTGKVVASKTGMIFAHSRRPKLIQPGCFEGPAAAWAPRRDTSLSTPSPTPVHLRIVGEHHLRRRSLFRLVEHEGHGSVDVPAYPHSGSVRAFRRAKDAVDRGREGQTPW